LRSIRSAFKSAALSTRAVTSPVLISLKTVPVFSLTGHVNRLRIGRDLVMAVILNGFAETSAGADYPLLSACSSVAKGLKLRTK
jgi:hypothetical protein